jgi:hypothetical protein
MMASFLRNWEDKYWMFKKSKIKLNIEIHLSVLTFTQKELKIEEISI